MNSVHEYNPDDSNDEEIEEKEEPPLKVKKTEGIKTKDVLTLTRIEFNLNQLKLHLAKYQKSIKDKENEEKEKKKKSKMMLLRFYKMLINKTFLTRFSESKIFFKSFKRSRFLTIS